MSWVLLLVLLLYWFVLLFAVSLPAFLYDLLWLSFTAAFCSLISAIPVDFVHLHCWCCSDRRDWDLDTLWPYRVKDLEMHPRDYKKSWSDLSLVIKTTIDRGDNKELTTKKKIEWEVTPLPPQKNNKKPRGLNKLKEKQRYKACLLTFIVEAKHQHVPTRIVCWGERIVQPPVSLNPRDLL